MNKPRYVMTIANDQGTFDFTISAEIFNALAGGEPTGDEDKVTITVTKYELNMEHEVAIEGTYL